MSVGRALVLIQVKCNKNKVPFYPHKVPLNSPFDRRTCACLEQVSKNKSKIIVPFITPTVMEELCKPEQINKIVKYLINQDQLHERNSALYKRSAS